MSYRCGGCGAHVDGPMRRHIVYRDSRSGGTEVASEVPACDACLRKLQSGATLASLRQRLTEKRAAQAVEPEYEGPQFG